MRIRKFNESISGDLTLDSNIPHRGQQISIRNFVETTAPLLIINKNKSIILSKILNDINHICDSILYFTDNGSEITFFKIEKSKKDNTWSYHIGIFPQMDGVIELHGINSFGPLNSFNFDGVRLESDIKKWIDVNVKSFDLLEKCVPFLKEQLKINNIKSCYHGFEIVLESLPIK